MTIYRRSHKSYSERAAERRAADAAKRDAQRAAEQTARAVEIDTRSYAERAQARRDEAFGRLQAEKIAEQEVREREAARLAALPDHARRPRNVWAELIEKWQSKSYDPAIRAKIDRYAELAKAEDLRIDAIVAEKRRKHQIETDPAVKRALEHCACASQFASGEDEKQDWNVARGLAEGGAVDAYWQLAFDLVGRAKEREAARLAAEADKLAAQKQEFDAIAARHDAVLETVKQSVEAVKQ